MKTSIRLRITALVAGSFAIVLVASSLLFLNWFEQRLVNEVRADDQEELDRQMDVIDLLAAVAEDDPEFLAPEEILEPTGNDDFPVALVPDDGTFITITNQDGVLVADTATSLRILTTPSPSEELQPIDGISLTPTELATAIDRVPQLLDRAEQEVSPATLEEFELSVRLLTELFSDTTVAEEGLEEAALSVELGRAMTDVFFGTDNRSSADGGRTIETTREATIIGLPVFVTATSQVTSIDAALDGVVKMLWFGIPSLVLLVAGLTYLATDRALRPVHSLTAQVDAINSARSGERVPEPETGDEINSLAVTMNGMLDRIEASADSQRRFVSDVSHELRTPAAVIRAEIEAGLEVPDNDWPKTAESVLVEQARLSSLVDDLLLLARMDEGGPMARTEIDLDALVQQEAARGWAHTVLTAGIEPVRLLGDARQLGRLVQNLLANADRHAASSIHLSLRAIGTTALLRIDDDGSGVPAVQRDRIFERFARLDESRERDTGGSGLGLAIVREVARAHGGDATVTNSPLGGARFEIRLAIDS